MRLAETVTTKNWEDREWKIRPSHFTVMEIPPPEDYTALQQPPPEFDELNPIGGFLLELEKSARKAPGSPGDMGCISVLPDAGYRLLQPIPVLLEQSEEGEWMACFEEANISMSGIEPEDARQALADDIVDAFALFLAEEETLGPEPVQQLAVLRRYLQPC